MKRMQRILALILILSGVLSAYGAAEDAVLIAEEPAAAPEFSEEPSAEDVSAAEFLTEVPNAEIEIGTTQEPNLTEPAPSGESELLPLPIDAPPAEPETSEPEEGGEIDYSRSAAFNPSFRQGYAALLGETVGREAASANARALYTLRSGIVYVLEREASVWLKAAFDDGTGEQTAWIAADALRPLDPEEAEAFVAARSTVEGARFHENNLLIPLDAPDCAAEGDAPVPNPSMIVEQTQFVLGVKESAQINVSFSDGQAHAVRYTSSDGKTALVSTSGTITGKRQGSATITITDEFEGTATVDVEVKKAPSSVKLASVARKKLGVGESIQLSASIAGDSSSKLTFSSDKPAVASVDKDGLVTALKAGKATISVRTFNGKRASVTLTVAAAPESVRLNASALTLGVGESASLGASVNAGSAGACSFHSDVPEVIEIDPFSGAYVARGVGNANIIVETYNGVSATCPVSVKPAPAAIHLAETELVIGVKEKVSLPEVTLEAPEGDCAGSYAIRSLNTKYVTVGSNGMLNGARAGSANIEVTTYNGLTAALKVTVKAAPSKVTLTPKTLKLGVGEVRQLSAVIPANAAGKLTYTGSNADVLDVSMEGLAVAKAPGSAKVTVATYNSKKATCTVTVVAAPESIQLSASALTLGVGESASLDASVNAGSAGACSFRSDAAEVIEIDPVSGAYVARGVGTANIIVETYNGVSAVCPVTVKPAPAAIHLAETELVIGVKEKVSLPEVSLESPEGDCASAFTVKSSNAKRVAIDAGNVIRGVQTGTANLTVSTYNGLTASLKVTVKSAPSKVTLSPKALTLGVGEVRQLSAALPKNTAGKISYVSSAPGVLDVSPEGLVTAKAPGSATVTVSSYNSKKATCAVTVAAAPQSVQLRLPAEVMGVGEVFTATAALSDDSAGSCTFSAEDSSIASIDAESGQITAVSAGSTTISVRTYNGCEDSKTLTVREAPTGIAFQESGITIAVGDSCQLLAPMLTGENSASGVITYKSSNSKYATVSSGGRVTALRKGSVTITATTYNNKKATLKINIKAAAKSISFPEAARTIFVGDAYMPTVSFENGVPGSYALSSSNPAVAEIVDERTVHALAGGSVVITATAYNGQTATLQLTVPALPDSISLQPSTLTLGAGESATLRAVMPDGQGSALRFASSNPEVATVNETGEVRALAFGSAIIRVYTQNDLSSESVITVLKAPSGVQLLPKRAFRSLDEGQLQLQLNFGAEGEGGSFTYESSDPSIASVSPSGLVSFHKTGDVQISARTYNGCIAVCDLTIGEKPAAMRFTENGYTVALGDCAALPIEFEGGCESVHYEVADPAIAVADGERICALAIGATQVTAVSRSGLTASCTLNVAAAPTGIALTPTEATIAMGYGKTLQLTARALPDGIGSIRFTTSDPSVATVDYDTGLITAVNHGQCVITATTYDGQHSARCAIDVFAPLAGVKIGIDPGHQRYADYKKERSSPKGGASKSRVSSGASGRATKIKEHVTNLQIGLKLRDLLQALGAEVYMTREVADINISNQERAKMMNALNVDLVLRLHCNSIDNSGANGLMLYVRKTCAYDASVVDGAALLDAENRLSKALMEEIPKATGAKRNNIVHNDNYTMNNWSTVPCVLVEMGYLSNYAEDRKLNTPEYQDQMAQGMVNAIFVYLGREMPE